MAQINFFLSALLQKQNKTAQINLLLSLLRDGALEQVSIVCHFRSTLLSDSTEGCKDPPLILVMTHFQKVRAYLARELASFSLSLDVHKLPRAATFEFRGAGVKLHSCRFYSRKANISENGGKFLRAKWRDAQAALVEYLHSTRGLSFSDADLISRHSPRFLQKLLDKVGDCEAEGRTRSLIRFLRYHPINEFEPFFESIGLNPSKYVPLLPRGFMSLNEDTLMFDNYHVLCNYGVPRDEIGKIYKEAKEVFGYGEGVLYEKLRFLEGLGMSNIDVVKTVSSHPHLLIGDGYKDFGPVLDKLRSLGFRCSWLQKNLPENRACNWRHIHELLCLLRDLGFFNEEIGNLITLHPDLLFDGSGSFTFFLIGFRLKLGSTVKDVRRMLSEFPEVEVSKFVANLKAAFLFLNEMEMDPADVEIIISSHYAWLGLCSLKKSVTILMYLRTSKKHVCDIIKENPLVLKSWVRGAKVNQLPSNCNKRDEEMAKKHKTNFLLSLGFIENSEKMTEALKLFRGRGEELQDRFDCFVKAGLDPEDVSKMVKAAPKILNQSKETIQAKIDCLVNELGYPISDLVSFPAYIAYTADRARLRHSMYKWLFDQGIAGPNLALSTLIACSEKMFIKTYVDSHAKGPEIWEELGKKIYNV